MHSTKNSFTYDAGKLDSDSIWGTDYVAVPNVGSVRFYGQSKAPSSVKNSNGDELTYLYEATTITLFVQLGDKTPSYNVHVVIA